MPISDPVARYAAEELFSRFGAAIDEAAFDRMDEMFVDDARWKLIPPGGGDVVSIEGRAAIKDFLAGARTPGQTRHVLTNLRLEQGALGSLTAHMYLTFCVTDDRFAVRGTGTYEAELAGSGSSWRFTALSLALDSSIG
jgi:hypothetical protein